MPNLEMLQREMRMERLRTSPANPDNRLGKLVENPTQKKGKKRGINYLFASIVIGLSLLNAPEASAHDTTGAVEPTNELFYDDFSGNELNRTRWDLSEAEGAAELTEIDGNNVLHITGKQSNYVSIGFKDTEVNNATVFEARVRVADFGTRDGVINFNLMSVNPGHGSGYSALMSSNGGFLADRNGGFQGLPSSQSTPFSLKKDQWHTVRFELENKELTLTVDGTVVHVAEVESEQSGKPVLIFDRGMEVFIDDVHVGDSADLATVLETSTATPTPELTPTSTPTPTATPTSEQTATPDATPESTPEEPLVLGVVEITKGPANIRSGASTADSILGSAQVGEEYKVVSVIEDPVTKNPIWFEIVLLEGDDAEPTATPSPTPTPTPSNTRNRQSQPHLGFISATLVKYTRDEKVAESLLPPNVLVSHESLTNFPTRITGERVALNKGQHFTMDVDLRQVEQLRTLDGTPLQLGVYYKFPNLEPRLNRYPKDPNVFLVGVVTDIAENGGNYVIAMSFPNEQTREWSTLYLLLRGGSETITVVGQDGRFVPAPTEKTRRTIIVSQDPGTEEVGYHDRTLIVPTTAGNVTLAVGQPAVASVDLDSQSSEADFHWNQDRTYEEALRQLLDEDHSNNGQVLFEPSDLMIPQSLAD